MKGDNASGNAYDIVVIRKDGKGTALKGPFIPDFCKRSPNVESDYTNKLVCFLTPFFRIYGIRIFLKFN